MELSALFIKISHLAKCEREILITWTIINRMNVEKRIFSIKLYSVSSTLTRYIKQNPHGKFQI